MLLCLVLFAMGAQSWALSTQCERSQSMKFSVSTWRNESGHRLVAADVSGRDSVSLAVELLTEKCADSRSVILKTLSSTGQPEEQASVSSAAAPTQPQEEASVDTTIAPTVLPLPGYHHISGIGYYKKLPDKMNWKDGVEACRKEGAHMLLLETPEEFDTVFEWVEFIGCLPWVGVHRAHSHAPWINVLGQQMNSRDLINWFQGSSRRQAHCVTLGYYSSRMAMFNFGCDNVKSVVCEQIL